VGSVAHRGAIDLDWIKQSALTHIVQQQGGFLLSQAQSECHVDQGRQDAAVL
jgi:hypothetical protein